MKKEVKQVIINPSDLILINKVKQREKIRKEFIEGKKEKYKSKEAPSSLKELKKEIVSHLKEVYEDG